MRFFILILFNFLFALDIDIKSIEERVKQSPNINDELVLARYYLDKEDFKKAQKYLSMASSIDKDNKDLKKLISLYKEKSYLYTLLSKYHYKNIDDLIEYLYKQQKYKIIKKIGLKISKNILNSKSRIIISRVLMWEGEYKRSLYFLKGLDKSLDFYEISAYDYYYLGNYKKAQKYFETLYFATNKLDYAYKLLDIYLYLGELDKFKKIVLILKRSGIDVSKQERKIKELENKRINNLLSIYYKNPTFENLKPIFWYYYNKDKNKALSILKEYIDNKDDKEAKLFYAKVLSWDNKYDEAEDILLELGNSVEAKLLLAKIFAYNQKYKQAITILKDIVKIGNKKQRYEAKKLLAFIKFWKNDYEYAKREFESLLKIKDDIEVKEALMIINKNYKPLIKKYELLLKKEPTNSDYILKLADFYQAENNIDKAIYYNQKYLKFHPEVVERYKILGELFLKKKDFYRAFSNLEYWAELKHTKEAKLKLAKYYYWYGFNREALKVLNEILKVNPKYEDAIKLKAEVLKVNPRFVTSKSAATIDDYFNNRAKQLLVLADRLYFASLYDSAIDYYKEYLVFNPNDYKVRERYALALEYSHNYKKAVGEFYNLYWLRGDSFSEFHYAYNLQKIGKLKKAQEIYSDVLKKASKPLPKFLKEFIFEWKKAWESMDINKYSKFYDNKKYSTFWKLKKDAIFRKSSFISVSIYDPILIEANNGIYKVKFFQVFASNLNKDKGYKFLTIKCLNKHNCKIIDEKWQEGKYKKVNVKNSIYFLARRNLNYINRILEKKNIDLDKLLKNYTIKKKSVNKVDIIPSAKKELLNEEEVLNKTKLIIEKKSHIIPVDYKNSTRNKNRNLSFNLDYFHDNQEVKSFKYSLNYYWDKYFNKYILLGGIKLDDRKGNVYGEYFGFGLKKYIEGYIFYDTLLHNIFGGFKFNLYRNEFNFKRENLIYTRNTFASKDIMMYYLGVSRYFENSKKSRWYSFSLEKIDNNYVLTAQFDYDFYYSKIKSFYYLLGLNGWYSYNTNPSNSYYSPKKVDNTQFSFKLFKSTGVGIINLKVESGYDFTDKSILYGYGLFLEKNKEDINYKIGCDFSNSRRVSTYKSIECNMDIGKLW